MYGLSEEGHPGSHEGDSEIKKTLSIAIKDQDLIELMRILLDEDAEGALAFLEAHFKGKARDLLEGG